MRNVPAAKLNAAIKFYDHDRPWAMGWRQCGQCCTELTSFVNEDDPLTCACSRNVGADRGGRWHDALADARTLARLFEHGAGQLARADRELVELVRAIGHDSSAWRLIAALQPKRAETPRHMPASDISDLLNHHLTVQAARAGSAPNSATSPRRAAASLRSTLRADVDCPRP